MRRSKKPNGLAVGCERSRFSTVIRKCVSPRNSLTLTFTIQKQRWLTYRLSKQHYHVSTLTHPG